MRPAIRTLHIPARRLPASRSVLGLRHDAHTSARVSQKLQQPAATQTQSQPGRQRDPQRTAPSSTAIINTEDMLSRILSQPSTSSARPALDAATLQIFLLSWQSSPAFRDLDCCKRLAGTVQSVYGVQARWVLGVMRRLQQLGDLRDVGVEAIPAETELLVAMQQEDVLKTHSALQQLFQVYTSQASACHIAFALLDVLTHHAESFIQALDTQQRIEVQSLCRDTLRRPRSPLARHQLWTFLLSDACAALLALPGRSSSFSIPNMSSDHEQLGQARADELAKTELASAFGNLTQAQHLHWIQNSKARPKFRSDAVEAFFRLQRHRQTDGKQQLKLVNLLAETAMGLLALSQTARALKLLRLWDGQRTQLYWFALIKVAAAADQDSSQPIESINSAVPAFAQSTTSLASHVSPSHLQGALEALPLTEMTPAIFVALLVAARHNIAWLSSLSKLAQSSQLASHRHVQEAVVEAVIACFEHHQQDLDLASFSLNPLQAQHQNTRIAAIQGRVQQAIEGAIEAALQATGVRTGNEAQRRDVRLTSILVRAISAALAQDRVDLALDVMLSEHVPLSLLNYQLVQRVASASTTSQTWSGRSGVSRVCQLFDKCDNDTLAQALYRPKLVFELLAVTLSTDRDTSYADAVDHTLALVRSFRDLVSKDEVGRFVTKAKAQEEVRAVVFRHLNA